LVVIAVLFLAAAFFWGSYEQVGSTLNLFAKKYSYNNLFGWDFPSSWWQSVHALLIIFFAPVFAWLWVYMAKSQKEPTIPVKFAWGLVLAGLSFVILIPAAKIVQGTEGVQVGPQWLFSVFFLQTLGELCLSPVGLSSMTKLAPQRLAGQMMGVWFLAASVGNFISGQVSSYFETIPLAEIFSTVFAFATTLGVLIFLFRKPLERLMGGVK
jgi:proton-dependent oligopeptide transporter, POT family